MDLLALFAVLLKDSALTLGGLGSLPLLRQDLVAGGVDVVPCSIPEARSMIDAGKVRALAVMDANPPALYPNVPTLRKELGTDWAIAASETAHLPIGYFGASTGAAAALAAAGVPRSPVKAIVSRGGRPDLAGDALPQVVAPTLLIVGSLDHHVIELNRMAYERLGGPKELVIIDGAGHLFEEPGTLAQVERHATRWFRYHLAGE